jgi:hypothetical protein
MGALLFAGAASGCGNEAAMPGAAVALSRSALTGSSQPRRIGGLELSAMGKGAARALHRLASRGRAPAPSLRALAPAAGGDADREGDQDDESGGPGPLEDGGELPGGNQGELSIAVDDSGQNVVIGFNDSRGFALQPISVSGFMWSDDGGRTLHDGGQLPAPPVADLGGTLLPQVFGDPDVKYLGACDFIYSSILLAPYGDGSAVQTLGFHRSRDCGHTWEGPFEITSASNPNGALADDGSPADAADKEFIDVDRTTGRVLVSWTNFSVGVEISSTYSDNVLAAVPTFSPRVILGNRDIDGQGSFPRFGVPGSATAYVAWATFLDDGSSGISVVRSDDNGASFGPPVDLVPAGFFPIDEILGNDRVHSFPSMTIDRSRGGARGTVYVTYAQNDHHDGADVVVQRSSNRGQSFEAPVFVTSRPGADRAQWFPSLASDTRTGRAFLFYYDQAVADSGDLTQTSFTFTSDGGRTWAQPRRLSPRTFHAGWGNDTSQPNLGDYTQGTVTRSGQFLAAYAITHPVGFRDDQPSRSMSVPEPTVSIVSRPEQVAITTVDLGAVTARELPDRSNRNGFIDAGETAEISFAVRNYVTNPLNARDIRGAVAIVRSLTPGARAALGGVTAFPPLRPGETRSSLAPIVITLDPAFAPGQDISLSIRVFSLDGAPMDLQATVHTGTPSPAVILVNENFDQVGASGLPAGWQSVHGSGVNTVPWTTSASFCGTASNAAFHVNVDDGVDPVVDNARWERLTSPSFTVPADADYVTVDLDVCTNTEDDPSFNVRAYDGLFLRVSDSTPGDTARSVLVEAFETDFTTDGFDGYPKHLPRGTNPNYFADMSAWAGDSGGLHHVRLRLPGMAGTTAQLRFEYTQDDIFNCAVVRPGASCGVMVDNVVVSSVTARR